MEIEHIENNEPCTFDDLEINEYFIYVFDGKGKGPPRQKLTSTQCFSFSALEMQEAEDFEVRRIKIKLQWWFI